MSSTTSDERTISTSPRGYGPRPATTRVVAGVFMRGWPKEWCPSVDGSRFGELGDRLQRAGIATCLEGLSQLDKSHLERNGFMHEELLEIRRVLRFNELAVPEWLSEE